MMKPLSMGLLMGALALGVGCGSNGGAGSPGSAGSGGSTGSGGSGGAGTCNTLANIGADVPVTADPGPAPAMTGGTIVDGTYVLTSQVNYAGGTNGSGTLKQTLVFTGNTVQGVQSGAGGPDEHQTIVMTPSGNQLTYTWTCGGSTGETLTRGYTATPTTFTLDLGNWVLTATKQ